MKKTRAVFYILAALFCLVSLATGSRIFYVLLFSQLFLLLAALLMDLWAAFSFTYLQDLSAGSTLRGRPVYLKLEIHNEKPVPYPLMRIRLATPNPQDKRVLDFNLAAKSMRVFDLSLECPHRGEYQVGMTLIDFIDVFGLMRLPFDMRLLPYYRMRNILVYPRLAILDSLGLPAIESKSFSRQIQATENQDEPFSMTRDYRRGDSRKLIHWKASLRQQKLQTRTFDLSTEPNIVLILDLGRPALPAEGALEAIDVCCECAAALTNYILRRNWLLEIVSLGKERGVQTAHSMKEFEKVYSWLAKVPFDGELPLADELRAEFAAERSGRQAIRAVILITARFDPSVPAVLIGRSYGQAPVYTLFAGPSAQQAGESALAAQISHAGLQAWFIHNGDDLAETLRWHP
jgi:uncharacterized protein (DUF58 family)